MFRGTVDTHCPTIFPAALPVTGPRLFSGFRRLLQVSEKYSSYSLTQIKTYGRGGPGDETAASSIQLQETLLALSMWLSSIEPADAFILELLPVLVCSASPNCF